MRVLLAVGNPNLASIFRKHLVLGKFDVIENDVFHRNYLNEILEMEKPDIILLHDTYLESDLQSEEEREQEILALLEYWRITYNDKLRVVYLCQRSRQDPFLGQLVARNVLDIFNEQHIDPGQFINQLIEPAQYSNVKRFGIGNIAIDYDEPEKNPSSKEEGKENKDSSNVKNSLLNASQQLSGQLKKFKKEKVAKKEASVDEASEDNISEDKESKSSKENKGDKAIKNNIPVTTIQDVEDIIDLMPIPKETYIQNRIFGTVVIGIASVRPHLGSTHIAQSISSYLHKKNYKVALVECNESEDFDRIQALYEGEKRYLKHIGQFELNGIDHYKYRENMNLGDIFTKYEYVILDIGDLSESTFYDEFARAHLKFVVSSPFEWKQHWIHEFQSMFPSRTDVTYIVPFASDEILEDLDERFPTAVFHEFPVVSNPYELKLPAEEAIESLLEEFLKEEKTTMFSKNTILLASLGSVTATALVISIFIFL